MRRMDIGSTPFYGDFTVVFNSALAVQPAGCLHVGAAGFPLCLYSGCLCVPGTRLKDSVLIAPFDSGFYTMCCC